MEEEEEEEEEDDGEEEEMRVALGASPLCKAPCKPHPNPNPRGAPVSTSHILSLVDRL